MHLSLWLTLLSGEAPTDGVLHWDDSAIRQTYHVVSCSEEEQILCWAELSQTIQTHPSYLLQLTLVSHPGPHSSSWYHISVRLSYNCLCPLINSLKKLNFNLTKPLQHKIIPEDAKFEGKCKWILKHSGKLCICLHRFYIWFSTIIWWCIHTYILLQ